MSPGAVDVPPAPAALIAALLGLLVVQGLVHRHPPAPVARSAPPAPASVPVVHRSPDAALVVARSLFTPGRGGEGVAAQARASLSDYALLGTTLVGRAGRALVSGPGGRIREVGVGQDLAGWRLVAVRPAAIVVRSGDEERVVPLGPRAEDPAVRPAGLLR